MLVKVVVDTNVWISALHNSAGAPRQIADGFQADKFVLVSSGELIAELARVLARPKFAGRIRSQQADRFLALIQRKAVLIQLSHVPQVSCDPKDDVFLACAAACNADFLVTGDYDLLNLKEHGKTRILTPRQFLDALGSAG